VLLVAGGTAHGRHSPVVLPALNIHQVNVAIISLSRAIIARVAIEATRALQHARDALEGSEANLS